MTFVLDVLARAKEAKLSQRDVARIVGVSPQSPSNWRRGSLPREVDTVNRLLYLNARLNELTPEEAGRLRNREARRAWVNRHVVEE